MAKRTISVEIELPDDIDGRILDEIESYIGAECWMMAREWTDPDHPSYAKNWDSFRIATGMNVRQSLKELTITVRKDNGDGCGP